MDLSPPRAAWIRERPLITIAAPLWHLQQTETHAGVGITSCALVIEPGGLERCEDLDDGSIERCPACSEHALRAS